MALATCASCGHKVSTTARSCPKCGALPPKLVYCTRCGGTMLEGATACPACGAARYDSTPLGSSEKPGQPSTANQPAEAPPSDASAKETAKVQSEWRCPNCRSENIQKLSVIYSEGSTSSTQTVLAIGLGDSNKRAGLGGAVGQVLGASSSTLAKSVAPPTQPTQFSPRLAGCLTAIVVFFLVLFVSWFVVAIINDLVSGNDYGSQPSTSADLLLGGILVVLPLVLALVFAVRSGSSVQRSTEQTQQREYPTKLAAYNEAMAKWQRSYFCHRCGNIFELQSS